MASNTQEGAEIPHIDILFLGDPGVGKATFLSKIQHVQHPSIAKREQAERLRRQQQEQQQQTSNATEAPPATTADLSTALPSHPATSDPPPPPPPPYTSTTSLPAYTPQQSHHPHPLTSPLPFTVSLFSRPYTITIHPSTSTLFTDPFPPTPNFIIFVFSIPHRHTLSNILTYWRPQFHLHYPASTAGVMLIGLQRDLRNSRTIMMEGDGTGNQENGKGWEGKKQVFECVMPEEGLEAARKMRADRYAECSAVTGELMYEVVEDITRGAAKTTLEGGDQPAEGGCEVM